jgi:hypothetical protein
MIDDVIERLGVHRVVLIHGSSGSGKSSLVRAGVLPKLARQHLRHGVDWLTCAMRPSGGPLWNLAREFARLEGRTDDLDRIGHIIRLFNGRGATLSSVVDTLDGLAGKRLCILVDQFEELFRFERETSREEAELFVELLIGQIADDDVPPQGSEAAPTAGPRGANIHIAITMRSEFLGDCARFNGFAEAVNRTQYLVPRIIHEKLVHAIRRPAQLYNGQVTTELAERLIADVRGREDELPLIQHGLMLLWTTARAAKPDEPISLGIEQFEHAGGLTKLLSDHADRVMMTANSSEEFTNVIERLFRGLTDINAEGRAIRRPQSFQELVALCGVPGSHLRAILDAFRADGVSFLTPYFPAEIKDKTVVDISHEALIRCWERIADPQNGWLRREFQDGLVWRSLLIDANAFEADRKYVLSPVATDQRVKWFAQQNAVWSERYGGGWEIVDRLLQASHRAATRSRKIRWLLLMPVFFVAIAGVMEFIQTYNDKEIPEPFDTLFNGLLALIGGLTTILITLLSIDYSRQYISSRLVRVLLVPCALVFTACGVFAIKLFEVPQVVNDTALFFLGCAVIAAGAWVVTLLGRPVLKYSAPLIRYFEKWRGHPHKMR